MTVSHTIQMKGHIIDSLTLTKITDLITESGSKYNVEELEIGRKESDPSFAKLTIKSDNYEELNKIIEITKKHGAILTKEVSNV